MCLFVANVTRDSQTNSGTRNHALRSRVSARYYIQPLSQNRQVMYWYLIFQCYRSDRPQIRKKPGPRCLLAYARSTRTRWYSGTTKDRRYCRSAPAHIGVVLFDRPGNRTPVDLERDCPDVVDQMRALEANVVRSGVVSGIFGHRKRTAGSSRLKDLVPR